MKKKLCFVVQRYGTEINGGAEAYCRIYAEKFADIYDITVLTTCALDYHEWKNYYDEATTVINNVTVHRFKVDYCREMENFARLCGRLFNNPLHTLEEALDWADKQGPVSSGLVKHIEEHKDDYDLFMFFTYLYWPSIAGINPVAEKSVLIPFCHDEPPVYLKCFDKLFSSPKGIIYNTDEEKAFIAKRFKITSMPNITTGIGLDIPPISSLPDGRKRFSLDSPFILYMGRVDACKGCDELVKWFAEYKKRYNNNLKLVFMGNEVMKLPRDKNIISLGFVSEEEKYAVLRECEALVLPSHFESLSIVVLEAFDFRKPVLVSGQCAVLKGHCVKSNGGLYFNNCSEFCECLELLRGEKELRDAMGENGKTYVNKNYQWDIIINKFTRFVDEMTE